MMAKKKGSTKPDSEEKESTSKSSHSLNDLPGVGDATLKKLKEAGASTSVAPRQTSPRKKPQGEIPDSYCQTLTVELTRCLDTKNKSWWWFTIYSRGDRISNPYHDRWDPVK